MVGEVYLQRLVYSGRGVEWGRVLVDLDIDTQIIMLHIGHIFL